MKVECVKNKLRALINAAEKITSKNHSLPVLSLVILEADKSTLKIKSTNLEVGLEAYLPCKVNTIGKVAVNAQVLSQLLNFSSLDNDKVVLELNNNNLLIKTSRSSSLIKTYSSEDFPSIPKINTNQVFTININDLVLGVKSVIYASAISDIKPEISSVYIYQSNQNLIFVATDSFRLAEKRIKCKINNQLSPLIIPFKNITEIIKVIESESGEVEIHTSENQISFLTENFYLTSRVINSAFPDYQQIIPKEFKTEVEVEKEELMNNLKMSNVFTDKFNQVTLSIVNNNLNITSKNQEVGENTVNTKALVVGSELIANFNSRYIIESFPSFDSLKIKMCFNEKNRPLLIKGVGDNSFQYLIMPINR